MVVEEEEEGAALLLVEAVAVGEADTEGCLGRSEGDEGPVLAVEVEEKRQREQEAGSGESLVEVKRKSFERQER